jgi:hypothetical protein
MPWHAVEDEDRRNPLMHTGGKGKHSKQSPLSMAKSFGPSLPPRFRETSNATAMSQDESYVLRQMSCRKLSCSRSYLLKSSKAKHLLFSTRQHQRFISHRDCGSEMIFSCPTTLIAVSQERSLGPTYLDDTHQSRSHGFISVSLCALFA